MNHPRFRRRVGLTRRLVILFVVVAGFIALVPVTSSVSQATVGIDDYPARLKTAPQDSLADPWLFYNRECTSFVAWRLNQDAGVSFHNYYLGVHWGNASDWKYAANQVGVPVDSTPQRGAVAWWAAGSPGSSRGHVAWVAGMTSSSITIEEYNYLSAGHYDQRTLYAGSSIWPSAFIHIGDRTLRNTATPSIKGTPKVAGKLTARPGSWTPSGATYSYQWLADGVPVIDATHRNFAPRPAQLGTRIQVQVTASAVAMGSQTATSARTTSVGPGDLRMRDRPSISGKPQVGVRLSSNPGTWTPSGARFTYQWLADGVAIDGARHHHFIPRADQLNTQIQVQVTASAVGMVSSTVTSPRTTSVSPGGLTLADRPRITGTPQVDSQLSATNGTWSPKASYTYQWNAGGLPVPGAVESTFAPTADQRGQRLSVTVTAIRAGYTTASSRTSRTASVAPATFGTLGTPTIAGAHQVDQPLTASSGHWSPVGTPSYQWYVAGSRVPGATGSTYTPSSDDLRKQVTVNVTMTRPGYTAVTSASAATPPVLPGTFQNSRDPLIAGTPRVGLSLTADPGGWSPAPTLSYQWYAEGTAITGATTATFTPTGAQLAKQVSVEVIARRPGYLTALTSASATGKVAPGTITRVVRPTISGSPVVGATIAASPGTWSVTPSRVGYQWFAGGFAITGATAASYSPTSAVLDQRLTVRVTVSADGYTSVSKNAAKTTPVVLGQAQFTSTPKLIGKAVLDRVLTAHPGSSSPSTTSVTYLWLRSGEAIAGATGSTYRLVAPDVGQRIAVLMTVSAPHWTSQTARVGAGRVRSVPTLDLRTRVVGHRVVLRLSVVAAGIRHPAGKAIVTERGSRVGKAFITRGRGRLALKHVSSGAHHEKITYHGPLQTTVVLRTDVIVP